MRASAKNLPKTTVIIPIYTPQTHTYQPIESLRRKHWVSGIFCEGRKPIDLKITRSSQPNSIHFLLCPQTTLRSLILSKLHNTNLPSPDRQSCLSSLAKISLSPFDRQSDKQESQQSC
ncbi:hypothetical protein [Chamaesiphon sp.]|uniref:hypothetical protein n=1 Tax=Chamaesiphon sp. TaxID=2814140 RepID=UPI003593EFF8